MYFLANVGTSILSTGAETHDIGTIFLKTAIIKNSGVWERGIAAAQEKEVKKN